MSTPGERFAEAIAAHDATALSVLVADKVEFRGMTPGRSWEADDPTVVVDIVLGNWFSETNQIRSVVRVEGDPVSDTRQVSYRFEIDNEDGAWLVEQQAYYRVEDGRIAWMRVLCSGYRPR